MKTMRRLRSLGWAGLGAVVMASVGCQTWVPGAGVTLPSPRYLQHPPQYFAPSPAFPLQRELASQEAIAAQANAAQAGAAVLPAPVAPPAAPAAPAAGQLPPPAPAQP